jgi:hypothetical protein
VTDIEQNKGRAVGNSNLHEPRFPNAGGTPVFAPPAKPSKTGTQTKEVLKHLQQIQQQKKSSSVLNNPAFLGAAMKAIYESSDVSIKRGDQTMVVTQLRDDEPTAELAMERRAPTAKEQPSQIDQSAPLSAKSDRLSRPDPFSSGPPIEPIQPVSTPGLTHAKANVRGGIDEPLMPSSSSYSITDILFWISLVLVFLGLAFWISP